MQIPKNVEMPPLKTLSPIWRSASRAHIAHTFAHARGATRDDRAREALRQMGGSVFKGGISTFFGICITGFAKSYIFWCFFKFLASIIAYAQFFGMVVMPVMLSLVGPMAPHATAPVAPA